MGLILRLVRWGAGLLCLTFLAVTLWTFLWPEGGEVPQAQAILCLGAGVAADGAIPEAARGRLRTCAALHADGAAPMLLVSEGVNPAGDVPGSRAMADYATSLGVPRDAIVEEPRARSTLQNALFARDLLPDASEVIVVTDAYHLPRAWASHRWAGFDTVHPVPARRLPGDDLPDRARSLVRETLAIWFNLGRVAAYSAGGLVGVEDATRLTWLD